MSYLTFEEYQKLTQADDDSRQLFETNLAKASAVLDNITSNFYQFNDLVTDVPFRAMRFKQALCAQIGYFNELGANTFEAINKAPQSFTLGRTSISNGSRYNASGENESKSLVAEDAYTYLEGTGLLYKGVVVW
ncbi:hypothetical protein ACWODG_06840 [Enterococcus italicus]